MITKDNLGGFTVTVDRDLAIHLNHESKQNYCITGYLKNYDITGPFKFIYCRSSDVFPQNNGIMMMSKEKNIFESRVLNISLSIGLHWFSIKLRVEEL